MVKPAGWKLLFGEPGRMMRARLVEKPLNNQQLENGAGWAVRWLKQAQDQGVDAGFGTYYLRSGWTSSYPETSGYIVDSLLSVVQATGDTNLEERCKKALDWLVEIQKESGGWASGYVHQDRPEVVFNTGQVLRGLLAGYRHFKEERYRLSAEKACDWLVRIQHENGYWDQHVYLDQIRVYDTYVAAPLDAWGLELGRTDYCQAARKNALWVVRSKQTENGWYPDADNTVKHNARPILHTIAYTLDGLLELAHRQGILEVTKKALVTAERLHEVFLREPLPKGRRDEQWRGSTEALLTGMAQTGLCFLKVYRITQDAKWKLAAERIAALLYQLQVRGEEWPKDWQGGIFGSAPFWGRYEPFGIPNWGVKYYLDLMFELLNERAKEQA